ncbi:hypothetical protein [Anaerosporobacter sp.]
MFAKDPMSRESRWKIKNIVLLILAIACYGIGVKTYYELRENYQSVSVQLQGEATTKKQVETVLEEEKEKYELEEDKEEEKTERKDNKNEVKKVPEVTAYEMEEHMKVTNRNFNRDKELTKYLVFGDMNQILPIQICRGNYVYEDDLEGCILDKDTAYGLFGSLDIIGQQVAIDENSKTKDSKDNNESSAQGENVTTTNEREYYVRGILDTSHPVVMVQARYDKTQFHYLQFDYGNSSRGREYVEQLMMIYPLGSSPVIVDQNLIVRLLGNVLFLPWLFAGIFIICKTIRFYFEYLKEKEYKNETLQHFIMKFVPAIITVLGIAITAKRFAFFPLQYIPTKWSDFNSVSRTMDLIRKHVEEFNYMTPTIREVLLRGNMNKLVMAVAGMIILIWVVIERVHIKNLVERDRQGFNP